MRSDPGAGGPLVRLRRAGLGYGRRPVLRDVDLEVRAGEFWFVLGPNGSGKTTLLWSILGLVAPRAGEVWRNPESASSDQVGFVPQRCAISPALPTTVREFVSLGRIGVEPDGGDRDLAWALDHAGLAGMERRDYWSLSGGQRQRALVARALVRRPRLLLLDEPTEGLDVHSERAFLATLDALQRDEGATLLFVTHRIALARRHASHVAFVCDGAVASGVANEILARDDARALFGDPAADPYDGAAT